MHKNETKFWHQIKNAGWKISFTRIENSASHGTPDLLCQNENHVFFTIELKLSLDKKIRFSPHQISYHVRHPKNTFILLKTLGPLAIKLYEGKDILEHVAKGHEPLEPVACGLEACGLWLERLGSCA